MSDYKRWLLAASLVVACALADAADRQAVTCRATPARAACHLLYASTADVPVMSSPDSTSTVASVLETAQPVIVDWRSTRAAPPGWVHVIRQGRAGSRNQSPDGWIRAADLVGDADFRRVDACWPVSSMRDHDTVDAPPLDVEFDQRGNASGGSVHVWRAGDVLRVGLRLSGAAVFAYDEAKATIFDPVMHRALIVTLFSEPPRGACGPGR